MPTQSVIVLRMWEGDFGVASVDPDSLLLLTLFKIYRVNYVGQYTSLPQWCAIPSLQIDGNDITESHDILLTAMKLCKHEFELDVVVQSQINVYKNYFLESFAPAFFIDCWIQEANFEYMTKSWYYQVIPFPFNYFYVTKKRKQAEERFEEMMGEHTQYKCILKYYKRAGRCLEDFAGMLDDNRLFVLGDTPTSLDALVFSYLAISLSLPLPDSTLQNLIKSHNSLTRFIRTMSQKYYPHLSAKYKYVKPFVVSSNERASTKSLIVAAVCVSTAMLMYAYVNGLIKPKLPRLRFF